MPDPFNGPNEGAPRPSTKRDAASAQLLARQELERQADALARDDSADNKAGSFSSAESTATVAVQTARPRIKAKRRADENLRAPLLGNGRISPDITAFVGFFSALNVSERSLFASSNFEAAGVPAASSSSTSSSTAANISPTASPSPRS